MAKQFKYIKKMAELGFTEETVSKTIKGQIDEINGAQRALAKATTDEERLEIETDIVNIDNWLVDAITKYPAKLENAKKMLAGKQAKQAERTKNPAPAPTPVAETSAPEAAPAMIAADGGQTETTPETSAETKEEKKGNGGLWGFVGLVAVTVAAVLGFKAYQNRA